MSFPFGFIDRMLRPLRRRSGIEAGGGGRRWIGAQHLTAPSQSTLAARATAKARSSAAYINTPYGNRIVEEWVSTLVGPGYQARAQHPDRAIARTLNDEFEALIAPVLIPAARALVRDGEAFIQIMTEARGELRLKIIPADQVDPALSRDLGNGGRIIAGVEFDAEDRVVAYHVLREAPGALFVTYGEPVRVPVADMLHVFDPIFPGQVRGLSWLSPVLLKLRDRDEASDALLMQLKIASMMTGFVRDPEGGAAGFDDAQSGKELNLSLEPGAMRILPPGAEVSFSQPGSGLTQAVDFLRAQDREIAAGAGITFEALTGDLGEANYSSARVGLLQFRRRAKMMQRSLIEDMALHPLWRRWIDTRALAGRIDSAEVEDYRRVRFIGPGWQWVDPQNEVAAEVQAIEAGLRSREEVIAARGRDVDEVDEERARDRASASQEGSQ